MFEVGFSELLLIAVIALLVLGPQKLPGVARQVGRWMGRARTMARQFRDQLEEESFLEETKLSTSTTSTDNKIVPQSIIAGEEKSDIPAADMSSGTLASGVPPDDDFAHHDIADKPDEPKSA